ncbi:Peptidase S41 family protein ustP [Pseudocercospora fuligena]|uniref:Peptidase S41 family protein ustP n=1 Tax=Pseudocercospora fuligena TaxID=685502 RepID=A0A8H6VCY2_9PEZI|nr:Peptidase S41 family protein ustP [Pseudocercospora fuligena]
MWLDAHDPDARYNHLFPSAAARLSGAYSGGAWTRYKGLWPGAASYRLRFANGSHTTVDTHASWPAANGPMIYERGADLFAAACLPNATFTFGMEKTPSGAVNDAASAAKMYPEADMEHDDTPIKLHYLPSARFPDVAVLQVASFKVHHNVSNYVAATEQMLQQAVTQGKTKLIIDLSDNNGGDVDVGLKLFRLLFPNQDVYSATRFRAHGLVDIMGQIFARSFAPGQAPIDLTILPHDAVNPAQAHVFQSWDELYGPHEYQGTNMSHLYAVSDLHATSTLPFVHKSRAFFQARDMVMLTNGRCSSTCALFAQQLHRHGVRAVTFGGRPRHGFAQAVGGNKGAQYWSVSTIGQYIAMALEMASNATKLRRRVEDEYLLAELQNLMPPLPADFPLRFNMQGESGINFRSSYDDDDGDIPRQFRYEAADCRRFFTADNIFQPESIWMDTAKAVSGEAYCVGTSKSHHSMQFGERMPLPSPHLPL